MPNRYRRTLRARGVLMPTIVIAGLLVLTLGGIGGTVAYLNAATTVPGATVRAGTLGLQINGTTTAALGAWTPTPNTPSARSFTITNTGDAPARITSQVSVSSTDAIRAFTSLRLVEVAGAASCTTGLGGGVTGSIESFPGGAVTDLAKTQTKTICAIVSLASNVPVARSGESVSFTLTLTATQQVS